MKGPRLEEKQLIPLGSNEKWLISELSQEKHKMNLDILWTEYKEMLNKKWSLSQFLFCSRASWMNSSWPKLNNLSIEIKVTILDYNLVEYNKYVSTLIKVFG